MSENSQVPETDEDAAMAAQAAAMAEAFMPLQRDGFDPIPALGQTRETQPVRKLQFPFGISAWLVTGYAEARKVLGDPAAFSNDFARLTETTGGIASAEQDPGGLGFADPPFHTRMRKALTPEFTMRRLQRLVPRIEEIVDQRLDALQQAGPGADFVEQVAMPVPSLVICELLDVPFPDREDFGRLTGSRFDIFGGVGTGLDAISDSLEYMGELVAQQRADPGEGLLGMLIREHGDDLTDRELAGLADGLLVGGHETTASMLALGTLVLMQAEPEVRASLDDEAATRKIVEELLRYLTVVQMAFPRFAKEDMEVGGVPIAAGEMLLVSLTANDRDPALGPDLERFVADREPVSHFAFGHGIHRCVGAELARMELRIAYPRLFARLPDLQPAVPAGQIAFRDYSVVHGVEALPVTW
nr:cytochrome P450 [Nakamurella alba]